MKANNVRRLVPAEKCEISKIANRVDGLWREHVSLNGLPNHVLHIKDALVRTDHSSAHFGAPRLGEIASTGDRFFLKGLMGKRDTKTVYLDTGKFEVAKDANAARVAFSKWSAGTLIDGRWSEFFSFQGRQ